MHFSHIDLARFVNQKKSATRAFPSALKMRGVARQKRSLSRKTELSLQRMRLRFAHPEGIANL